MDYYRLMYLTVTDASVHSLAELKEIIISNNGKRIVQLKDIADVTINEGIEYTKINANGQEGLLVAVVKQPNTNLIELSDAVKKKAAELQKIEQPIAKAATAAVREAAELAKTAARANIAGAGFSRKATSTISTVLRRSARHSGRRL